jgi:hypothetical protein
MTLALTPLSEVSMDTMAMEPPATRKAMSLGSNEGHEMVVVHQ